MVLENPLLLNVAIGTACSMGGMLVTLYVKDKAREAAKEQLKEELTGLFAVFKNELIASLDDVYRRKGECILMNDALHDRLDISDKRLESLDARIASLSHIVRKKDA